MAKQKRPKGRAATADRHELYELSVQDPPSEVAFTTSTFRKLRGREALSVREDFCGTAVFSLAWVKSHPQRTAIGVDLDRETLMWGLDKRIRPAGGDYESRLTLRNGNVLEPSAPLADVAVGFNFSYWCFDTRDSLRTYFEAARAGLTSDGVLYLDAYGGTEVCMHDVNEREVRDETGVINDGETFIYVWEQVEFNPLTSHMDCAIHFEFEDESRIDNAFTYSWRVWSLAELSELLQEAGFTNVRIWTEDEDEDGDGLGTYSEVDDLDNEGVWWVYISAENC
ncbi:class I SAM-dependent methyltransferase [Enhygromyxa salina]|uniref:Uncharacterized protein n=1 Tax=Enhygromyxa salina TaxID=215803 RepID=A0A2S9YX54_9BACT|nr:class I SAM-dependent methyltransferase [Enhygromyxa salina]PRQ09639.1 hypothetical protein ENSA7_07010 [Enhygromyxa salina]